MCLKKIKLVIGFALVQFFGFFTELDWCLGVHFHFAVMNADTREFDEKDGLEEDDVRDCLRCFTQLSDDELSGPPQQLTNSNECVPSQTRPLVLRFRESR